MSTVINLRGTSGTGKTTIVKEVMAAFDDVNPLYTEHSLRKPEAYQLTGEAVSPTFVIGSYENVCGGCDGIKTQDEICRRVRHYVPQGNVIFEGLLISHIFGRYEQMAKEMEAAGHRYIWAFLDTPLELCLERVQARRDARGATSPFNPKNTIDKWHDMRRVFQKCQRSHLEAYWLSHEDPTPQVMEWLNASR